MKMLVEYPLCTVPAVATTDGRIVFLHPDAEYVIDNHVADVWMILRECNGYQSRTEILSKLNALDQDLCNSLIDDLAELGVLIDSRSLYRHVHSISDNPPYFKRLLSDKEIAEHYESSQIDLHIGRSLALPGPSNKLVEVLASRTSCRSFDQVKIPSLENLSNILQGAYSFATNPVPSAGGLYPLKVFLFVTSEIVQGYPAGYYQYDPGTQTIILLDEGIDRENIEYLFDMSPPLHGAPIILVIAADFERASYKYSNRAYRYVLLEAGHVAQNVHTLAATEGLNTLEYGGFCDSLLHAELQLFAEETPVITIGLGFSSPDSADSEMTLAAKLERELVGRGKPVNSVFISQGGDPGAEEYFYAATARYRSTSHSNAKKSYRDRYATGTATTTAGAKIKAIAEGYERFASGLVRADITARADELDEEWVNPSDIAPYSAEQYAQMPYLQSFAEDQRLEWVEGHRVFSGKKCWVPIDLVFFPLSPAKLGRKLCYQANSSGVAAFSDSKTATKRALLELFERDAVMRSWFTKLPGNRIAPADIPSHWRRRIQFWELNDRESFVFDHSHSGVYIAEVMLVSRSEYPSMTSGAASSESSFAEAVAKAFQEAEVLLMHERKQRRHHKPIAPRDVSSVHDHAKLFFYPDHFAELSWLFEAAFSSPSIQDESLDNYIERIDPVVVRLSPPNSMLEVVRVLTPDLIPINFGFGTEHYSHQKLYGRVALNSFEVPHYFA